MHRIGEKGLYFLSFFYIITGENNISSPCPLLLTIVPIYKSSNDSSQFASVLECISDQQMNAVSITWYGKSSITR